MSEPRPTPGHREIVEGSEEHGLDTRSVRSGDVCLAEVACEPNFLASCRVLPGNRIRSYRICPACLWRVGCVARSMCISSFRVRLSTISSIMASSRGIMVPVPLGAVSRRAIFIARVDFDLVVSIRRDVHRAEDSQWCVPSSKVSKCSWVTTPASSRSADVCRVAPALNTGKTALTNSLCRGHDPQFAITTSRYFVPQFSLPNTSLVTKMRKRNPREITCQVKLCGGRDGASRRYHKCGPLWTLEV